MRFILRHSLFLILFISQWALASALIINGKIVSADNVVAKSVVNLLKQDENGIWYSICTGSIIDKNTIITAAHCVFEFKPETILVNFSIVTLDNEKQNFKISRIVNPEIGLDVRKVSAYLVHPKYVINQMDRPNDIAIVRLSKPAPNTAIPIKFLPKKIISDKNNQFSLEGQSYSVTLMGFGLISESPRKGSTQLRMTDVVGTFEKGILVTDQTKGTGACNGDSGGPAFLKIKNKTYLVGVTSGPYGDAQTCDQFGAYANPNLNLDFITKALKTLN